MRTAFEAFHKRTCQEPLDGALADGVRHDKPLVYREHMLWLGGVFTFHPCACPRPVNGF
ncbi:MAG TPA: hypothetical protein VJ783_19755 [Pirellulales bacterium]|nr:hypothetical protein [Pirellulales bacterium]